MELEKEMQRILDLRCNDSHQFMDWVKNDSGEKGQEILKLESEINKEKDNESIKEESK